jgi:hypothetical protein
LTVSTKIQAPVVEATASFSAASTRLTPLTTPPFACDASREGSVYYSSTAKALVVCTGSGGWVSPNSGDGSSAQSPGTTCATILTKFPSAASGVYWVDPAKNGTAFQVYCDMTFDGGGWALLSAIRHPTFFSATVGSANFWEHRDAGNPGTSEFYSILYRRSLFMVGSTYTLRTVKQRNSENLRTGTRSSWIAWSQNHDPFTATTNGADYTFLAGQAPTTCGGFNGLHNRYQTYSVASDVDSLDGTSCWYEMMVPTSLYGGASGYLDGHFGSSLAGHLGQTVWVR